MISTRSVGLLIDTVVCLTLAKWETVSGRFGGYLRYRRDHIITLKGPSHDRHHLAPLRHFSLCGESSDRAWPQAPCLGIGRASRHHAETESDGADGRLSQDAGSADWRGHLLRQPVDPARTRAPVPQDRKSVV